MNLPSTHILFTLSIFLGWEFYAIPLAIGQDLNSIGKEKPIKISGSIGTTQTFYTVSGIPYRRPPYMAYINGGLTLSVYKWTIPISVTWSNLNRTAFRQPFSQYGLSPTYKWITLHAGYRNMTFSPYTLAGYTFLGGGVDLTPGIFRFSAMYGRLNKAIKEDTISASNEVPSYKRMGMGFKIGVGKNNSFIDLIWFTAKDDVSSIATPVRNNILPAENMVFSVNVQKQLGKRIVFAAEYAKSAYTRDLRASKEPGANSEIFNPFFNILNSTQFFNAIKSSITYNADIYSIGIAYERIDPEYRTLGAYFFNNDLENITVAPSLRLFKQRMNLNANFGVQRNNIDNHDINSIKRILGSLNVSYVPNQNWSFAGQYSNFKTYNKISSSFNQFRNLDTLNFFQVTESANFNTGYNSTGKDKRHGVNLNLTFQRANQTQGEQVTSNTSQFYNTNLFYRYSLMPLQLTFSAGVNGNQSVIAGMNSRGLGPTASITKMFLNKKLRTSFTTTLNNIYTERALTGRAINIVLGSNYNINKNTSFLLNAIVLNKNSRTSQTYTEFTGNVGFNYSF